MRDLVKDGILNDLTSYLEPVKRSSNINEAKLNTVKLINACNLSETHKSKLIKGLDSKRTLTDVMIFAYNISLKGEGLGAL